MAVDDSVDGKWTSVKNVDVLVYQSNLARRSVILFIEIQNDK